jgi:hypothetical protein
MPLKINLQLQSRIHNTQKKILPELLVNKKQLPISVKGTWAHIACSNFLFYYQNIAVCSADGLFLLTLTYAYFPQTSYNFLMPSSVNCPFPQEKKTKDIFYITFVYL